MGSSMPMQRHKSMGPPHLPSEMDRRETKGKQFNSSLLPSMQHRVSYMFPRTE